MTKHSKGCKCLILIVCICLQLTSVGCHYYNYDSLDKYGMPLCALCMRTFTGTTSTIYESTPFVFTLQKIFLKSSVDLIYARVLEPGTRIVDVLFKNPPLLYLPFRNSF